VPKQIFTWGSDSTCLGEIRKFQSPYLPLWNVLSVIAVSMDWIGYQVTFFSAHLLLWFRDIFVSSGWPEMFHPPSNWSIQWTLTLLIHSTLRCELCQQVFPHWAGHMFWWMAKNLRTHNTYDAWAASLLNSAVQIESPWWHMSRILPCNRPVRAYIHWSPPCIDNDLQCMVAQIGNKETVIVGRDHYIEQWGVQRLCIRHGGRNWKVRDFNSRDWRK